MGDYVHFGSLGDLDRLLLIVNGLPEITVVRHVQHGLRFAGGILEADFHVFAARVHVRLEINDGGRHVEGRAGVAFVVGITGRDREVGVGDADGE